MLKRARYVHTNLIARNWRALAAFYEGVFGCTPVPPERNYAGRDLEAGTGVPGATLQGMHLRLSGHGPEGPTLEIFSYSIVAGFVSVVAEIGMWIKRYWNRTLALNILVFHAVVFAGLFALYQFEQTVAHRSIFAMMFRTFTGSSYIPCWSGKDRKRGKNLPTIETLEAELAGEKGYYPQSEKYQDTRLETLPAIRTSSSSCP